MKWDSKELPWEALFPKLRAGSRTVFYRPPSEQLVVELARRGFRLLVAHESEEFRTTCRTALRDSGLQSQIMGSHQLRPDRPLKLARNFYDLVLLAGPAVEEQATDWSCFLSRGGVVVGPDTLMESFRDSEMEGLPEPFAGFRAP